MDTLDKAARPSPKVDKRAVLFVAVVASFLTPFMGSSINVAIPSIGREFSASAVSLSWIATVYLLAAAVFLVPIGKIADNTGRRRIFLAGMLGYTIVSLLCSLATSENVLIALRGLQGFTDAMMFGTSTAIVTTVFPPQERGRALGINVAGVYTGLSLGPVIGGSMTHFLGWRSIFLLTAALGLLAVVLTVRSIKGEWAEMREEKFDLVGSLMYGITLLAVMYGLSLLPAPLGFWLVLAGLVCLVAFILWESRVPNPVLDVGLFRHNVVFSLSLLAALINYAATFALGFMLSLYLQYIKGLDSNTAGMVILSQPIIMAALSPLAGRLSDHVEARLVASAGMGLTTVGLILVAFVDAGSSLAYIVAALVFCGLGFALFSSPNMNVVMSSVDKKIYGVAASTVGVMRLIGQMLSMGIAVLIIATYVGNVQITPDYYPAFISGFRFAFTLFAALCLVGLFASLVRAGARPNRQLAHSGKPE